MERPRGLIAAWVCACCAQRRRPAVALTKPAPLLVNVLIVPEFETPAPLPYAPEPPFPPLIVPLLVSAVIVLAFSIPAPPAPPNKSALPPVPPLIAPLLVNVLIVPEFETPALPGPRFRRFTTWRVLIWRCRPV